MCHRPQHAIVRTPTSGTRPRPIILVELSALARRLARRWATFERNQPSRADPPGSILPSREFSGRVSSNGLSSPAPVDLAVVSGSFLLGAPSPG